MAYKPINNYNIEDIDNLAESNEICAECKNQSTSSMWCDNCDAKAAEEKPASSGNFTIDDFIKNNVKRANSYKDYWEWILYERFRDVINLEDSQKLLEATWLDGEKVSNDQIDQTDKSTKARSDPIKVILFITDETDLSILINNANISLPKIYGLSFLPVMRKYVYVIQYSQTFDALKLDQLLSVKTNQLQKNYERNNGNLEVDQLQSVKTQNITEKINGVFHRVHHQIIHNSQIVLTPSQLLLSLLFIIFVSYCTFYAPFGVDYFCEIIPGSEEIFPRICMVSIPDFKKLIDIHVETQKELIKHNSKFGSPYNGPLVYQIKEVELVGRDLLTVVEYSKLNSAPLLAGHLKDFIAWSYTINKNLQELQVQSQASLSNALLYIGYTLSKLENMRGKTLTSRHLKDIDKTFHELILATDDNLRKLIKSTNDVSLGVSSLQNIQSSISSIVEKERGVNVKENTFSNAWEFFGNQVDTTIFVKNLKLLEEFDISKKLISSSIMDIRDQLNLFEKQLNILRSGTNKPLLVDIPFELHLAHIKDALLKLGSSTAAGNRIK